MIAKPFATFDLMILDLGRLDSGQTSGKLYANYDIKEIAYCVEVIDGK